jgi:drug/metabolite transporter (DMT)-like permease
MSPLIWLTPTLAAMLFWGIAQGLVKKYIGDVPPARFCLYYALANAAVNVTFWAVQDAPPPFAAEYREFAALGLLAYAMDGIGWIFYYQSIVHGPISIVGTLSAAYPAISVLCARLFLDETLSPAQYAGVGAVIGGCLALAWAPPAARAEPTRRRWMAYAGTAVAIWGVNATIIRYAYSFPGADEANMALFIAIGGLATLGIYGWLFGRHGATSRAEWGRSFLPMAAMAIGGLLTAIAYRYGPASIVTPLTGAYPVITLAFARVVLKERPTPVQWAGIVSVLLGMVLTTMAAA